MRARTSVVIFTTLAVSSAALADVGVSRYQRLDTFVAALEVPLFECFDDADGPQTITAWSPLFIDSIEGTNRGGDPVEQIVYGADDFEFTPLIDAEPPSAPHILSNDPSEDARFATGRMRLGFSAPMNAIGFFVADGNASGTFFVEMFQGDDLVARVVSNGQRELPNSFLGVVSSLPFDAVEIGATVAGDSWGIDDLYVQRAEPCRGDIDHNASVDLDDLVRMLTRWGPCPGCHCPSDLDRTGTVDFMDLCLLLSAWGECQ